MHGPQQVFLNGFKSSKLVLNTGRGQATDDKNSMESLAQNQVPETEQGLLYSESKWNRWRALSNWGHKWTHGCPSKYNQTFSGCSNSVEIFKWLSLIESTLNFNITFKYNFFHYQTEEKNISHPRSSQQNHWLTTNIPVPSLWALWVQEGPPERNPLTPPSNIRQETQSSTVYVSCRKESLAPTTALKKTFKPLRSISVAFGLQTI